ncbi:lamina-associated polypeptide 2, isoforms alpha/zeta-like [Crotalus tigris]|uniref:lamina-associated polypeptide 2, isoforms alpha/zeta-like n=1 Tax=Crotalus tigris TaxID=88082 RepID=UPI00192FB228|nr:lamina-associated polypeptide 2, isoforms alpha/zeta-like [Crotalus tigris]
MIAQAEAQFMASTTTQPPTAPPQSIYHSQSPDIIDEASSDLESTGAETSGLIMSDDEGITPSDPAPPVSLFNFLLLKACTTANLPQEQETPPTTSKVLTPYMLSPRSLRIIFPALPFFLNIVQKQWENLGFLSNPGAIEKTLFNVAPSLASLLEIPQIDEPLNSLFPNASIPEDVNEALRAEDKKIEAALRRSHLASAWATKASTSMAFFARASVLWLRELQDMIPPDQLRAHQNLGKLVAASQYLADASLHTARYTARTIAAGISARRLLWLRNWRADTKAKWRLASKPYTGGHLFGKALEPYLIEGKDKRKTLVNSARKGDKHSGNSLSQGNYQRQPFRPAPSWDWAQASRSSFQRQERQHGSFSI